MTIYLGADHRGFQFKQKLLDVLVAQKFQVMDCGNTVLDLEDNYPDFTFAVAEKVALDPQSKGVVLCGSGVGATIAANKIKGIRCGLGFTTDQVKAGRHDDDMNVLTIATDFTPPDLAEELVMTFLKTEFGNEVRYLDRLKAISQKENL